MVEQSIQEDIEARRASQSVYDTHLVLEAGAGTGKTATLVSRVVTWALSSGWNKYEHQLGEESRAPQAEEVAWEVSRRIVAITFTEKAAQEMADRIGLALQALSVATELTTDTVVALNPEFLTGPEGEVLQRDVISQRARALLAVADQFVVKTIHAYCRRLLSRFPQQAHLHFSFSIDADETEVEKTIVEVLLRDVNDAFYFPEHPNRDGYNYLLSNGVEIGEIAEALMDLVRKGVVSQDFKYDPCTPENLHHQYTAIMAVLRTLLQEYEGEKINSVHQRIKALSEQLLRVFSNYLEGRVSLLEHEEQLLALWEDPLLSTAVQDFKKQAKKPSQIAKSKGLQMHFQEVRDVMSSVLKFRPYFLQISRGVLQRVLKTLREKLRRRGIQTFGDLLSYTGRLLAEHPSIARVLSEEMDLLLVDEFQDTSSLQCQIIEHLALRENGPALFIVGDPKQAIYGWRNADISSYFHFVDKVCSDHEGRRFSLCRNFRSTPVILREVAAIIEPVMIKDEGLQPSFRNLIPHREAEVHDKEKDGYVPVSYWVTWPNKEDYASLTKVKAGESRQVEALALADDIATLVDRGLAEFKDCAVLFRSMTNVELYIGALRQRGIPYVVSGDKNYYKRREIIEVASLIRVLFDPFDQVALIALFRSSIVGLPDVALYPLWKEGFPQFFIEATAEEDCAVQMQHFADVLTATSKRNTGVTGLSELGDWISRFVYIVRSLIELRSDLNRLPTDVLFNKIRRRFLIDVLESSAYQGAYRIANLDRFFRDLQQEVERDSGHWGRVLTFLRRAIQQAQEQKEARPKEAADNAVQMMSIHSSKGLDFAHVYVLDLAKEDPRFGNSENRIVQNERMASAAYSLLGASTLDFPQILQREELRGRYERVRLLYVAITRAKNRLVLSGNFPLSPKETTVVSSSSFMDLLYVNAPQMGRCHTLPKNVFDMAQESEQVGRIQQVGSARFNFVTPPLELSTLSRPVLLSEFSLQQFRSEQQRFAQNRKQMNKLAEKKIGECSSSVVDLLQQVDVFGDSPDRQAYLLFSQGILSLIRRDKSLFDLTEQGKQKVLRYFHEHLQSRFGLRVMELAQSMTWTNAGLWSQQGPMLLSGEGLLLPSNAHQALYQEYVIQGLVKELFRYRLIEYVWHWETLMEFVPDICRRDLLLHRVAKQLEKRFHLGQGMIECELWDLSNGNIHRV